MVRKGRQRLYPGCVSSNLPVVVTQLPLLAGGLATDIRRLVDKGIQVDGFPSIGSSDWWSFATHGRPDWAVFVASFEGQSDVVGYAHVRKSDSGAGIIELLVDPDHRRQEFEIGLALVSAALQASLGEASSTHLWVTRPRESHDRIARVIGVDSVRNVQQLRMMLEGVREPTIVTESFRPGIDDDEWIAVNNRAFAHHPDQSNFTNERLDRLVHDPSFNASGFRLYRAEGRICGFCWTKIHNPCADCGVPAHGLGEIFVIGINPDYQGKGLGAELVLSGLKSLANTGLVEAMLYVEDDNVGALRLYERLGFKVHHIDRGYQLLQPGLN